MRTETLEQGYGLDPSQSRRLKGLFFNTLRLMKTWHSRQKGRVEISQLDGHLLNDIGLTPYDAHAEIHKPFWIK